MQRELLGTSTCPMEAAVVERIVACWLQVQYAELSTTQHDDDQQANYWQARLDQAQRRYLAAIKALDGIRKLLEPPKSPGATG